MNALKSVIDHLERVAARRAAKAPVTRRRAWRWLRPAAVVSAVGLAAAAAVPVTALASPSQPITQIPIISRDTRFVTAQSAFSYIHAPAGAKRRRRYQEKYPPYLRCSSGSCQSRPLIVPRQEGVPQWQVIGSSASSNSA
jgi:hypothetical protein